MKKLPLLTSILGATVFVTSCIGPARPTVTQDVSSPGKDAYTLAEIPADQVFRDHDGYRVEYTNEHGRWVEEKFPEGFLNPTLENPCWVTPLPKIPQGIFTDYTRAGVARVAVFSDLEKRRGYARTATWNYDIARGCGGYGRSSYTEIHLPKSAKLSPGNETYGGKFAISEPMHEIR
jgi:hypothetical protein